MSEYIKGTCNDFCAADERKLRIKENLLNFYELENGNKSAPGVLVTEFSRSAAGTRSRKAKDLRTEACLNRVVEYLLKNIIMDKRKLYNFAYDFIFNRLRAVRQEIVIQNFNSIQTARLLEPMIMFLSYSRYRLCEESVEDFDPKICEQHLQECLKRVLCCYDEIPLDDMKPQEIYRRTFIEALYVVFNLNSTEALHRLIALPEKIKKDPLIKLARSIALAGVHGNIYRVLQGIKQLPHILCAIASLQIQTIRKKLYEIFSEAYNSPVCTVSISFICRMTLQPDPNDVITDCQYYRLKVTKDRTEVHFVKADFRRDLPPVRNRREHLVEYKLSEINLSDLLLLKKLKVERDETESRATALVIKF